MAGKFSPCSQWRRNGGQSARREPAAQRRSRAIGAEPLVGGFGPVVGRDGVFHTSRSVAVALPGRVNGGYQLLRHAVAGADTPATDRFRSHQRWPHAPQCRRRQRADRRLRLFRQDDPPHWAQTHHGEWCLAARLSGRRDRRRALLGWWPRLEHAAGLDGGCRAGEGHTGVPGRSVVRARTVSSQHDARRDAAEGDPVLQPHPRGIQAFQATAALQEPGGAIAGQAAAGTGGHARRWHDCAVSASARSET